MSILFYAMKRLSVVLSVPSVFPAARLGIDKNVMYA